LKRCEYTIHDYLDLEAHSGVKHEYVDGTIYAMTGGTRDHAELIMNIGFELKRASSRIGCRVFSSDLRVRPDRDAILYPDISVVCGKPEMDSEDQLALRNPCLIVEVTSPSSVRYDRDGKFELYKQFASLREYVIASHAERLIEVFRRSRDGEWQRFEATGGELELETIADSINVDAVYKGPAIPPRSPDEDGPAS
jgi:Uma2 family endonuclease